MELRHYVRILSAHKWLVIASVLVCTSAAAALAWTTTPVYTAQTQLFVSANGAPDDPGATYQSGLFSQERVLSYVQIVTSPAVLDPVIRQLGLQEGTGDLAGKIKASVPSGTVLLNVAVDDPSPAKASAIARAVAAQFVPFVSQLEKPEGAQRSRVAVTVTKPAEVPTSPSSPRKPIYLALGIFFGLVLGVVGAFVREAFDRRIRTEEDATDASGAPVLATVKGSKHEPLAAVTEPSSPSAEAYRRLRASLSATLGTQGSRTLIVSSAAEEEGTSAVAANLAIAFAQAGQRVVVVDANLRDPQLAAMFGLAPPRGLTDVVRDDLTLRAVLQPWTGRPTLTVIGTGSDPSNPGELLASRRAFEVLRELDEGFDVVIVDSPPLLEFSDGALIAQASSGVIIVARSGSTRADDLSAAVDSLRTVDVRTLGVVLYHRGRGGRRRRPTSSSRRRAEVPKIAPLEGDGLPVR